MNNISPLAYIHPEAKLGDNNNIGPFCFIDKDTVLGDNNNLLNSVTIHQGARIGSNNEFFPGASISTKPQDLKFRGEHTTCEVGDNNSIRENVTISRGTASKGRTVVGNNNLLMENMHIGHDCVVGNGVIIGNSTKFAGEVTIDDNAIVIRKFFDESAEKGLHVPVQGIIGNQRFIHQIEASADRPCSIPAFCKRVKRVRRAPLLTRKVQGFLSR